MHDLSMSVSIEQILRRSREHVGFNFRQLIHDQYHAGAKILWRPRGALFDITLGSASFNRHQLHRLTRLGNRLKHGCVTRHGERRYAERQIRCRNDDDGGNNDDDDNNNDRAASQALHSAPHPTRTCREIVVHSEFALEHERLRQPDDDRTNSYDGRNPHDGRPHHNNHREESSGHQGTGADNLEPVEQHRTEP